MPVVRQAVGADHAARMPDDAAHVVLVHLEITGSAGLQAQAGLVLRYAPFGGDGGQHAACHLGIGRRPAHHHVDDAVHQVLAQHGRAGHVGVDIHRDVLTPGQFVNQRQGLLRATPVGRPCALVVRNDQGYARLESAVAGLVHRLQDLGHFRAHVGGVDAPVPGDDTRQRRNLGCRSRHGFSVKQSRRHANGTVGHALVHQRAHPRDLIVSGRSGEVVHGGAAQCGMSDQQCNVDGRPGLRYSPRVGGHRRVFERVAQQRQRPFRLADHIGCDGQPAIAGDDGGDALRQLGCHAWRVQHNGIVVGMYVDEAGCDSQASAIADVHILHGDAGRCGIAQHRANGHDPVAIQQHVAGATRRAGAVDDEPVRQQDGARHVLPFRPLAASPQSRRG